MMIPTLLQYMNDPAITDICIHEKSSISIERQGDHRMVKIPINSPNAEQELKQWILENLSAIGKSWDAKHPFADAILSSGHRLHVVFPPITPMITISLRRIAKQQRFWAQQEHFEFLASKVRAGETMIISGATGSGKTTLMNELISQIASHERILILEDTAELLPEHEQCIKLTARPPNADGFGEVSLQAIVKQTLRMRPDRIILGECRGSEVLDLLQILNTGHRGALATLHAHSPRDALRRIELLCLLSTHTLSLHAIRELLGLGINWLVHVDRTNHGQRHIASISQMAGREGDTLLLRNVLEQQKV